MVAPCGGAFGGGPALAIAVPCATRLDATTIAWADEEELEADEEEEEKDEEEEEEAEEAEEAEEEDCC